MTAALDTSQLSGRDITPSDAASPAGESASPDASPAASDTPSQTPPGSSGPLPQDAAPAPVQKESHAPGHNEIVVSARQSSPADPVEEVNQISYEAVQAVDSAIIAPVTHVYRDGIPKPIRHGIRNVLNNLDEPIVFLNFLLQLKPGKAFETLGRFAINTTIGVGGLFDVAKNKPFNLPRRSNGLADTLGYYGVGPGPYLFLPLIGATTLRDVLARPFDLLILPTLVPDPFAEPTVALAKNTLSALDEREQNDERLARIRAAADPYVVQREEYLARRQAEIDVLKGKRKSIYEPLYYQLPELPQDEEKAQEAPAPAPVPAEPVKVPESTAPAAPVPESVQP